MIRLLIADDHRMFLQSLVVMFEAEDDIKVVGQAQNGVEAVQLAGERKPDVVLMDVKMPVMNGVEATRAILAKAPDTGVVMLTMMRDEELVFSAIETGARGYILKDAGAEELLAAVRTVAKGHSALDPSLATRILNEFKRLSQTVTTPRNPGLTTRDLFILKMIAQGASNREIGEQLQLSEKTIKNYITAIFHKLQLNDRTQAAVYAVQNGLIENVRSPVGTSSQ
jgi:two-component system, NarL family, response regulator LiaR